MVLVTVMGSTEKSGKVSGLSEHGAATPPGFSEAWYRTFYEYSPSMDFIVDEEGTVLLVNRFGAEQLGYDREDLAGRPILDVYREEDQEDILRHLEGCLENPGQLFQNEFRKVRKDGSMVWVQDSSRAIKMPDGRTVVLISCEDVTKLKRLQQKLARLSERHKRILESAGEGICCLDLEGKVVFSNLPGAEMLGYEVEELVDLPLHEIVHHTRGDGTAYPLEECAIQAAFKDGKTHRVTDEVFWRKDGTSFPVEYTSTPTQENGEVSGAVVTFQNITERKRAEEAVFEIREAERRRIARDLHDIALQDLVGVLQSIQASRMELKDPGSSVNLEPEIKALQTAIQGLRNAIHDLRAEEKQDFVEAVEALVELNRQLTPERKIELDIVEDGARLRELPEVVGTELLRVIREALVNVRRHARARRVEVIIGMDGDEVWAEVADDGCGFDSETVRKGVGLSGMQERIVALEGEMKVKSEIGKGTRMTARLPTHGL